MSLDQAVTIIYSVMDDLKLTRLEKGRVLAELSSTDENSHLAECVWIEAEKRMRERGISVAPVVEDDGA
jgi:hypothetical protein